MKTYKCISKYNDWIYYLINKSRHGFYNDNNICIGYYYKNKDKGFWLEKFKR